MRRKTRKLSADDRAVWQAVTAGIAPIQRVTDPVRRATVPPPPVPKSRDSTVAPPSPTRNGAVLPPPRSAVKPAMRIDWAPDPMDALRAAAPAMDARVLQRLRKGKLKPEARLDLHGMTLDRAHPALTQFILSAQAQGRRLVLVITGKGRAAQDAPAHRRGILRNAVPGWLGQAPLRAAVMQVVPAHDRHGGGGAYYVYLRRRR